MRLSRKENIIFWFVLIPLLMIGVFASVKLWFLEFYGPSVITMIVTLWGYFYIAYIVSKDEREEWTQ